MTKLGTKDLSSTSAKKHFFGDLALWKSNFSLHLSKDLNFRHTSKKIKGGSPKKILEKKMFSPKSMSNLGRLTVCINMYSTVQSIKIFWCKTGNRRQYRIRSVYWLLSLYIKHVAEQQGKNYEQLKIVCMCENRSEAWNEYT